MKIINKFLQEADDIQIYCDLDGVLTNWDAQFMKYARIFADDYKKKYGEGGMWKLINNIGVKFWSTMEWTSDGKQLWNFIKPYKPIILSKPSLHKSSIIGKRIWIEKELGKDIPYIMERDKSKHAEKGSILIDDMVENIYPWKKNKGIGILHRTANETIAKLKNKMR